MVDFLISFVDLHSKITSFRPLSTWFGRHSLLHSNVTQQDKKATNIATSTITPAYTTTQLLLPNASPCILTRYRNNLFMLFEFTSLREAFCSSNEKKSNSTDKAKTSCHKVRSYSMHSPKDAAMTQSHKHVRAARSNSNHLRMLVIETNMIRATKIVRPLKPRKSYLSSRKDVFVHGRPSSLGKQ